MAARTLEPFDPDVVAPWSLGSGRRGALLIHGFASTPPEMRRLGEHLAQRGWRCVAPALPGHGLSPHDLHRTRWTDWVAGVQHEFDALAAECDDVVVAGQSMGGALALHLAATDLRVRAVASLATPLWLPGFVQHLLPVLSRVVRWHTPTSDIDLWDQAAVDELWTYGIRSTASILELKRLCDAVGDELAQVRAPVVVLHGGRDRTIDPANAPAIVARLICSAATDLHIYPRSGHAISIDVDREDVNRRVTDWFERYSPPSRRRTVSESSTGFDGGPSSIGALARRAGRSPDR